ncbi:hypothetical protein EDM22_16795, partial [Agromyces tardus]
MIDESDAAEPTPGDGETPAGDVEPTREPTGDGVANAAPDHGAPAGGVLARIGAFARRHRVPLVIAAAVVAFALL